MFGKTLYEELIKFSKKDKVRAHMPGHNGGEGLSSKFKRNAFKIDLTELDGTDELQEPTGNNQKEPGARRKRLWSQADVLPGKRLNSGT